MDYDDDDDEVIIVITTPMAATTATTTTKIIFKMIVACYLGYWIDLIMIMTTIMIIEIT